MNAPSNQLPANNLNAGGSDINHVPDPGCGPQVRAPGAAGTRAMDLIRATFFDDGHACPYGHGCVDERRCGRAGHCTHGGAGHAGP